jgi:hypothetical protein
MSAFEQHRVAEAFATVLRSARYGSAGTRYAHTALHRLAHRERNDEVIRARVSPRQLDAESVSSAL